MKPVLDFIKHETVLCVSALAAAVSCFFVPPDAGYLGYVDLRTIALLYCLMVVVSGFRKAGLFDAAAVRLCSRAKSARGLGLTLTALCFFSSMLITNDVALLTFVPFTAIVLAQCGEGGALALTVVLETLAANLGSMLTPVGNPQNLYLYSRYRMPLGSFLGCTAPVCALGLVCILLLCLLLPKRAVSYAHGGPAPRPERRPLMLSAALFALSLAVVLRAVEWYVMLPVFVLALLIFDRGLLRRADFLLLLTFVCFFVFVGNLGRMDAVRAALGSVIQGRELFAGAAVSQVISNVPAAALLSGFTENGYALLLGVDIGGLGTPVASLASLISLKIYLLQPGARGGRYMAAFSAANFGLLAVLLSFAYFVLI